MEWDTLDQAFKSITTSKQVLNWWGEDLDGEILGYYYKWSSDTSWTFTDLESGVFMFLFVLNLMFLVLK